MNYIANIGFGVPGPQAHEEIYLSCELLGERPWAKSRRFFYVGLRKAGLSLMLAIGLPCKSPASTASTDAKAALDFRNWAKQYRLSSARVDSLIGKATSGQVAPSYFVTETESLRKYFQSSLEYLNATKPLEPQEKAKLAYRAELKQMIELLDILSPLALGKTAEVDKVASIGASTKVLGKFADRIAGI